MWSSWPPRTCAATVSQGVIAQIYPDVTAGQVTADVTAPGLPQDLVGQRVRAQIKIGQRQALVVPRRYIATRFGVDYVSIVRHRRHGLGNAGPDHGGPGRRPGGNPFRPARRRRADPAGGAMNLGLSGRLTKATIKSPLTPLFLLAAIAVGLLALATIPREEEPQISVPMVDIMVPRPAFARRTRWNWSASRWRPSSRAWRASSTSTPSPTTTRCMVTARFKVGTDPDAPSVRIHEKIRANYDRIPAGIPEPLIRTRGINDVPKSRADPVAQARRRRVNGPTRRSMRSPASCAPRSPRSTTSA